MITETIKSLDEIKSRTTTLLDKETLEKVGKVNQDMIRELNMILKSNAMEKKIDLIQKIDIKEISYDEIAEFQKDFENCHDEVKNIKERLDIELFFKKGQYFNVKKLKAKFHAKRLFKKFPNFNWDVYEKFLTNPPLELTMPTGTIAKYDSYVVRKLITLFNQMIFNEQDIYIVITGSEGSGKSCWSSQVSYYLANIVLEVGLNNYEYDHKDIYWTDIEGMLDFQEELPYNDYFREYVVDEGDRLSRSNWNQKDTKDFKVQMRRDRKHLRITIINLPQFGELDTSIIESRANIVFYTDTSSDAETGLLEKGFCDMFIIPRSEFIYSELHGKEISRTAILTYFRGLLKDKSRYYERPSRIYACQTFRFGEAWSFDKGKYEKNIIKQNRARRENKNSFSITIENGYVIMKCMPDLSEWKNCSNKKEDVIGYRRYMTISRVKKKIRNYFQNHPDKLQSLEQTEKIKAKVED